MGQFSMFNIAKKMNKLISYRLTHKNFRTEREILEFERTKEVRLKKAFNKLINEPEKERGDIASPPS